MNIMCSGINNKVLGILVQLTLIILLVIPGAVYILLQAFDE